MKYTKFAEIPRFTRDASYAVDYPLDYLIRWIKSEEIESRLQLCPIFQRGHVWTEQQQIAFLEFLLRGGKTGRDLYFNCPSWHRQVKSGNYNEFVCVDGLQRITAIQKFLENKIQVFRSFYYEYTDKMRFCQDTMRVHINDLKTEEEVLQWYIDLNAGGTPHTNDEIERVRHLLNDACSKVLYYEVSLESPEILGSGSSFDKEVQTQDLENAMRLLADGRNRLVRICADKNGHRHTEYWDPDRQTFRH